MWVQHCFKEVILNWLQEYPRMVTAWRLEGEENLVTQVFERFWLVTASNKPMEFSILAPTMQYLRATSLGTILDTLRRCSWPREISLTDSGESCRKDVTSGSEI